MQGKHVLEYGKGVLEELLVWNRNLDIEHPKVNWDVVGSIFTGAQIAFRNGLAQF